MLEGTLTVRQLINHLEQFPDDMPVVLQGDYGDRLNTPEAHFVEEGQLATLSDTSYSNTGWKVNNREDDEDREPEEGEVRAVVLSYSSHY